MTLSVGRQATVYIAFQDRFHYPRGTVVSYRALLMNLDPMGLTQMVILAQDWGGGGGALAPQME